MIIKLKLFGKLGSSELEQSVEAAEFLSSSVGSVASPFEIEINPLSPADWSLFLAKNKPRSSSDASIRDSIIQYISGGKEELKQKLDEKPGYLLIPFAEEQKRNQESFKSKWAAGEEREAGIKEAAKERYKKYLTSTKVFARRLDSTTFHPAFQKTKQNIPIRPI